MPSPKDPFDIRKRYVNRTRLSLVPSPTTQFKTRADGLLEPILGPIMSDPASDKDPIIPVPKPRLIDALNPPAWVKVALSILAVACASLPAMAAAGITLPPVLVTISGIVTSLLVGLGIVSNGVAAKPADPPK